MAAALLTGRTQERCSFCPGPVIGSAWNLFCPFTTWACSGSCVALTLLYPLGPMVHTGCAYSHFKLSGGASMATLTTVGCCWGTWSNTYCAHGDCRVLRLFSHSWGSLLYSGSLEINRKLAEKHQEKNDTINYWKVPRIKNWLKDCLMSKDTKDMTWSLLHFFLKYKCFKC